MQTITQDSKTGVITAKIFYKVKDSEDPNAIHWFPTEVVAYELTNYKVPGKKNKNIRLAAYVVTGRKPEQWNICHAETTSGGYLSTAILTIDTDYVNDNATIADMVKKYHDCRKAGPITEEQRAELNRIFRESAKEAISWKS